MKDILKPYKQLGSKDEMRPWVQGVHYYDTYYIYCDGHYLIKRPHDGTLVGKSFDVFTGEEMFDIGKPDFNCVMPELDTQMFGAEVNTTELYNELEPLNKTLKEEHKKDYNKLSLKYESVIMLGHIGVCAQRLFYLMRYCKSQGVSILEVHASEHNRCIVFTASDVYILLMPKMISEEITPPNLSTVLTLNPDKAKKYVENGGYIMNWRLEEYQKDPTDYNKRWYLDKVEEYITSMENSIFSEFLTEGLIKTFKSKVE